MSDSQKPPRVCWVYPEVFYKEEWRKQNRYDEMVYMIEHSAYQSAIERIEKLEKALNELIDHMGATWCIACDDSPAHCILGDAIKIYVDDAQKPEVKDE